MASMPFTFVDRGDGDQSRCVRQGGARSAPVAGDLAGGGFAAAQAIMPKSAAEIPMTTAWPNLDPAEQYSALHNILRSPMKADGLDGLNAHPGDHQQVACEAHSARLLEMAKDGTFNMGGRDNAADPLLVSGQAGIHFDSSGMRGDLGEERRPRLGRGVPAA